MRCGFLRRPSRLLQRCPDGHSYLLIPLSVVLVFFILGALWWAIYRGQFDDVDREGERILEQD